MIIKWHPCPGHPNYQINRLAQVRSVKTGKLLKPYDDGSGYLRVKLDGENCRLHILVALVFIPNPENKPVVNHKHGKKHDCRASQLEWATISENTKHAWDHGLIQRGGGKTVAGEKNFENRLKKWLEDEGIYPLGEPVDRMSAPPCGYWEKRWGGGRYVKSGLPDMRIVVKGLALEVELKATTGTPSELQKRNIAQINNSGCFGFILYPEGFETFKKIVKGVKQCEFPTAGLISLIDAHTDTACDMWKG